MRTGTGERSTLAGALDAIGRTPHIDAINAVDPDLRPYFSRGGKLLMYHGWADPQTPPQNSIRYYNRVREAVGDKAASDSLRLFMVPGMGHCEGGDGTDTFDEVAALAGWVERGETPDPHRRLPAERRQARSNAAAVPVPERRPLDRPRQQRRRGHFHLHRTMTPITTDRLVSTAEVRRALIERREIALLDVRDEAAFAEAHPLFAASLPLDRLGRRSVRSHPAPHNAHRRLRRRRAARA